VVPFFKERSKTGVLPITDTRMTRFWITLDQAVHFVLSVLEKAKGGEIFVPKIPSMNISDLASAIAPECTQKVVGIRPGEKIHETLISEDEGRNTVEYKECFVIRQAGQHESSAPEGSGFDFNGGKPCPDGFRYSSDNNSSHITIDDLRKMLGEISEDYAIEKSRWSMEDLPQ
jgi:UDP-N-acetylglucosamine 4,6-dehydratase